MSQELLLILVTGATSPWLLSPWERKFRGSRVRRASHSQVPLLPTCLSVCLSLCRSWVPPHPLPVCPFLVYFHLSLLLLLLPSSPGGQICGPIHPLWGHGGSLLGLPGSATAVGAVAEAQPEGADLEDLVLEWAVSGTSEGWPSRGVWPCQ